MRVRGVPAPFPKVLGDGWLGKGALALNVALIHVAPTWFSYQIFVQADTTPDVQYVLRSARRFHTIIPPAAIEE